jgi:malonyl-CoA O-methyltransferase
MPATELIAQRFRRRLASYGEAAVVQKAMAQTLIEQLSRVHAAPAFANVIELACGTGFLTQALLERFHVQHLVVNDLVAAFEGNIAEIIRTAGVGRYAFLPGDMEQLALPHGMNLILSNASFQWLGDPAAFLERAVRHLAPGGLLAFGTFGPQQYVEISALTGEGLRYLTLDACCDTLAPLGTIHYAHEEPVRLAFQSPLTALAHIRDTGVNAVRPRFWTRQDQKAFAQRYQAQFPHAQGVRLTYHPIYVIFQKAVAP